MHISHAIHQAFATQMRCIFRSVRILLLVNTKNDAVITDKIR